MKDRLKHLERWAKSPNYIGATYYDYYVVYGKHRDSGILECVNFDIIIENLSATEEKLGIAEQGIVDVARATHWAVGWVETILVRIDAPDEILIEADDFLEQLTGYPILDEDRYFEAQMEEAIAYWGMASISERLEIIHRCSGGVNMFAARHELFSDRMSDIDGSDILDATIEYYGLY